MRRRGVLSILPLVLAWLAGVLTKGYGFGVLGNMAIGVIGALIGGFLFRLIGLSAVSNVGSVIVATISLPPHREKDPTDPLTPPSVDGVQHRRTRSRLLQPRGDSVQQGESAS